MDDVKTTQDNPFLVALSEFKVGINDVSNKEDQLNNIKSQLVGKLKQAEKFNDETINDEHALYQLANEIKLSVNTKVKQWDKKLSDASPMRALSEQFSDRVILLVFGKVNAGKSSFSNYIADLFNPSEVKRFFFDKGEVKYFEGQFAEGVTETTAQIQGVELGSNLVLLDSPGLHSIVNENGDLTRRYTDSADAVLWLTSSSSPGQVQELEDLKLELEKKKPLQPVLTKSDKMEEDWCDEADDLVQTLFNKTADVRKAQEDDVFSRVKDLGEVEKLKTAVSVSVHAYKKQHEQNPNALEESGLTELFKRLANIVDEANVYKVSKAQQQMVNFLNGEVLKPMDQDILPKVLELQTSLQEMTENLRFKQNNLSSQILDNVLCEVPLIVDKHMGSRDKKALGHDVNKLIEKEISETLRHELRDVVKDIKKVSSDLSGANLGDFNDITIDIEKVSGKAKQSASSSAGAAAGMAIGGLFGGPIGAMIGGAIGGYGGNKAGEMIFVEITTEKLSVGVSPDNVIQTTSEAIRTNLTAQVKTVFEEVNRSFEPLQLYAENIVVAINECQQQTRNLRVHNA
ncbi:dynamin family protein [Photobacterium sanguinicancri]|uniref:50S ribosome-binding GTPase n=2 Tax=Photobacterium sanguinicancri TaxID=875932 RepID=A0AAW7YEP2_9GAMM|nr:dynamin family protein [Photobacterium sanguinicancri]MDO6545298.1 50S ribosome-binding GTPase [Photobacterium sanguinicancri]